MHFLHAGRTMLCSKEYKTKNKVSNVNARVPLKWISDLSKNLFRCAFRNLHTRMDINHFSRLHAKSFVVYHWSMM